MLVRLDVVLGEAQRERRLRVVPADEMRLLRLELLLDTIPQPGDDVARAVAVDRLIEPQGGVDYQIGDVRVRAFARVAEQEAQDALPRSGGRGDVLVDRRQGGLRQENRERHVARSLASPAPSIAGAPQDRPGDRDRLTQGAGTHGPKIKGWWRLGRLVEVAPLR